MQATIFGIFQKQEVSVDVVATSEVSISLTLDPSKIWSRDLIDDELDSLVSSFGEVAKVRIDRRIWAWVPTCGREASAWPASTTCHSFMSCD